MDCSDSTGVTVNTDNAPLISFVINDPTDIVDCTYTNELLQGALRIHKDRKHAADGPGDHPHAGVTFDVEGTDYVTDSAGNICLDGLTPGDYTITEELPAGYHNATLTDEYTVVDDTTCTTAEVSSFLNTPLTNVSISVDSQIAGGTSSTISCDDGSSSGPGDDISLALTDQQPKTLVCTILIDP